MSEHRVITRRNLLQAGAGGLVAAGLSGPLSAVAGTPERAAGSLPDAKRPPGTPNPNMPFDHIVVLMMENRSFDHYFGMLPRRGQAKADGFHFNRHHHPTDRNPLHGKHMPVFSVDGNPCSAADSGSQSWNDTHKQINGGRMNGFAKTGPGSMAYFTNKTIPFYYSLAKTFTLANRWFCSAPCQTYPNRRFLMAGTAYGNIATETSSIWTPTGGFAAPPPHGTIFDRLHSYGVSWKNYFTDLPQTAIIPSVFLTYPRNVVPSSEFFADCAAGTLPAVSYLDPEFGAAAEVGGELQSFPVPTFQPLGTNIAEQNGDEENPADIQLGEHFVHRVVEAVMHGPLWHKTLLVWFYDEHGGWYDHVPPPRAPKPDHIAPDRQPGDEKGTYGRYGPRVPAVVVSPHSRPHAVTNVVHDHTSVLATIEAKWNLPAMTRRDANARTVMDFIDRHHMHFRTPPTLTKPGSLVPGERACLAGQDPPPKPR
jgi:phospholipase C